MLWETEHASTILLLYCSNPERHLTYGNKEMNLIPGKLDSIIEGSRKQQAILLSVKGKASDLFNVDGNVMIGFEIHSADFFYPKP